MSTNVGRKAALGLNPDVEATTKILTFANLDTIWESHLRPVVEDHLEMGRFDEALSGCKRIIAIDPDYPRTYAVMADLYWEVFGQLDEGVRWLHKSIELDPGNPDHARWLGMVYLDLGELVAGEY